jgi:hypothetical protein
VQLRCDDADAWPDVGDVFGLSSAMACLMTPDPNHMPRGTYPVTLRCLCRGNGRYHSTKCPDREAHGVWADAGWYDDPPPFDDPVMRGAAEYHAEWMAGRAAEREARRGDAA